MAGAGRFFQARMTRTTSRVRAQRDEGHDPRGAIEAGAGGSGEDSRAVFLHERLLDQAVAVAAAHGGHEFVAHAVGVGAADVIALEKDLVAAADAHQSDGRAR